MAKRSSNQVQVFAAESGFRVLRRECRERAEQLVLMEALRPEFDQVSGELLGYRVLGAELRKVDSELRSMKTTAGISAAEMQLNVSKSHTVCMSEARRMERTKNGLPPEDRVERVKAKVRVYAVIGAAHGDILRVWPR